MTKPHGNVGNKNAAKDVKQEARFLLKILPDEKASWVKAAKQSGMSLTTFIRGAANAQADKMKKRPQKKEQK